MHHLPQPSFGVNLIEQLAHCFFTPKYRAVVRSGIRSKAPEGSELFAKGANVAGASISSRVWTRPSAHYSRSVV